MNKTTGAIIIGLIAIIAVSLYNDYKHNQRITSLESRVQELEKSRGEILSYKKDRIQYVSNINRK